MASNKADWKIAQRTIAGSTLLSLSIKDWQKLYETKVFHSKQANVTFGQQLFKLLLITWWALYIVGAFGKRHKGWTRDSLLSTRAFTLTMPQRAAHLACFRSCWWTCARCPQVCSGRDEEVHFYCIVASWWLFCPPSACLLAFISYKVWVHPLEKEFLLLDYWILHLLR